MLFSRRRCSSVTAPLSTELFVDGGEDECVEGGEGTTAAAGIRTHEPRRFRLVYALPTSLPSEVAAHISLNSRDNSDTGASL